MEVEHASIQAAEVQAELHNVVESQVGDHLEGGGGLGGFGRVLGGRGVGGFGGRGEIWGKREVWRSFESFGGGLRGFFRGVLEEIWRGFWESLGGG